jgi:hypothetical protein
MYLCNCLGGMKKLGFVMQALGECMKKREMPLIFLESFLL